MFYLSADFAGNVTDRKTDEEPIDESLMMQIEDRRQNIFGDCLNLDKTQVLESDKLQGMVKLESTKSKTFLKTFLNVSTDSSYLEQIKEKIDRESQCDITKFWQRLETLTDPRGCDSFVSGYLNPFGYYTPALNKAIKECLMMDADKNGH
jgi:hypothetical protein